VFATGQGRETDATDAHSVALRILVDRRRSLGEDHTRMVSRLPDLRRAASDASAYPSIG